MNPVSLRNARTLASNPAAVAMMLAAARHKAETNVKNESDAAAEKADKAEVTLDVGTGTISASGISVEDLGKVQQDAYDQPYDELAPIAESMKAIYAKRAEKLKPENIRGELKTHEGRLRAAKELGANWLSGRLQARRIRTGKISEDSAVDQIATFRAKRLARDYADINPILDDLNKGANVRSAAQRAEDAAARQRRKDVFGHIAKADLGALTLQQIAAQTGVDQTELESDPAVMEEVAKRRRDLTLKGAKEGATERRKRVAGLKLDDVAGGGSFEQWRTDTEAQVGTLSESETRQAQAKWRSFEDKVNDENEREAAKLRAEARAIAGQERAAEAGERAAAAAERAVGASERAERGEQRSVQRAADAERRVEINRLGTEIDQTYAKIQANSLAFTKTKKPAERAELQRQNKELTVKQRQLFGALTAARGGRGASSAAAGYSPRQEAAITAHMKTNNLARAAAIKELQTAGILPKK